MKSAISRSIASHSERHSSIKSIKSVPIQPLDSRGDILCISTAAWMNSEWTWPPSGIRASKSCASFTAMSRCLVSVPLPESTWTFPDNQATADFHMVTCRMNLDSYFQYLITHSGRNNCDKSWGMTRETNPFSMAMGSWIAKHCRVELEGIVKVWIPFSSAFGCSLENHSCTRDEEL